VYKLVAVQHGGKWVSALKLSETPAKVPNPGPKRVWRVYDRRGNATADLLSLADEDPREEQPLRLHHPVEPGVQRTLGSEEISEIEPILEDVIVDGRISYGRPSIADMRAKREKDLGRLDIGVKRLVNPHIYHVSLTEALWQMKQALIASARPNG
jgi:nicotinate phosphoribosyltransferase